MKKPNFFIVGAPKCGTTSLVAWLSEHEEIFMSTPKEPHYFNFDSGHHSVFDIESYEALFQDANEGHHAVGEASVWYLTSQVAAKNIVEYQPDAKFIVCLRNPVEMTVSLHGQMLYNTDENITNFKDAWNAQDDREKGNNIPSTCKGVDHVLYGSSCKLGELLQRLYDEVGEQQVLTIFMDDLRVNPRNEYLRVLDFLGLDADSRQSFPVVNVAKKRRFIWLRTLSRRWFLFKQKMGIPFGFGIADFFEKYNFVERKNPALDENMKQTLISYFKDDISLLSKLTNRNLDQWTK